MDSRWEAFGKPMRKVTNSLLAGQFAALLATELVFLLNPEVHHTWTSVLSVFGVLAMTYGIACGVGFWLLLGVVEAVRGQKLRPAWLSFRILSWLAALTLVGAAALFWHNLVNLRLFLPGETLRSLAVAATVVSAAAAAFFVMVLFHYSFGRKGARVRTVSYLLSSVSLAAAVTLPLIMRPRPSAEPPRALVPVADEALSRRVTLIGIEGASFATVLAAVAEGKLPNFGRLIETGASGPLRTLYPTESLAIWTSIATGELPRGHGLKSFYRYHFPGVGAHFSLQPRGIDFRPLDRVGLVQRSAATAALRRSQTFWSILSRFGVDVGIVRWWGTYPADEVRGFVVSEYFHRQVRERFRPALPDLTFPEELFPRLSSQVVFPESIGPEMLDDFVDSGVPVEDEDFPWKMELTRALAEDLTYRSIANRLREEYDPDVLAVYFFGLDAVGHYFTRYQLPDRFGDVSDAEIRRYGRVVESYYRYLDAILGEYLQRRAENETLIVLSGHGMEPLSLARRIVEPFKGNRHVSGTHENAPDGLLILNGAGIASGRRIQQASVLDITPTLLYLMGLPLGRDLDGMLLTEVLSEELVRNQPVTFISSYRDVFVEPRKRDEWLLLGSPLDALPELLERVE